MKNRRSRAATDRNLVAFEVGGVAYAIDIQRVREIVRPLPMVALPYLPPAVVGVVDHRGDVVPVVDLRIRFGAQATGRDKDVRWLIVTRGSRLLGIVVDRVLEVFGAAGSATRDAPDINSGQAQRGIKGACSHGGRLLFVLDVDQLTAVVEELALPPEPPPMLARGGRE
jgi:purine-binding chemotaxis protein CheW